MRDNIINSLTVYNKWREMILNMLAYCLENFDDLAIHFFSYLEKLGIDDYIVPSENGLSRKECIYFDEKLYVIRDITNDINELSLIENCFDFYQIAQRYQDDYKAVIWAADTLLKEIEFDLINYDKDNEKWKNIYLDLLDPSKIANMIYEKALTMLKSEGKPLEDIYIDLKDCNQRVKQLYRDIYNIFDQLNLKDQKYKEVYGDEPSPENKKGDDLNELS